MKNLFYILLLAALFAGCKPQAGVTDAREREDPLLRRALRHEQAGDLDAAIKAYSEAVRINPGLARAHLDLALLLHEHKREYVGAVYHYRQYLAMRPDSQKKDMIRERIRLALQLFAATIAGPDRTAAGSIPEIAALNDEKLRLENENTMLKSRITELRSRIVALEEALSSAGSKPTAQAGRPAVPSPEPVRYRVQPGDSLSSIALQFYGDANRARDIFDRNRDIIRDRNRLLVGQELILP